MKIRKAVSAVVLSSVMLVGVAAMPASAETSTSGEHAKPKTEVRHEPVLTDKQRAEAKKRVEARIAAEKKKVDARRAAEAKKKADLKPKVEARKAELKKKVEKRKSDRK